MSNDETNFDKQSAENAPKQEDLPEKSLEALFKQITDLQDQTEKHKENYLRCVADFDNYRRRTTREIEEIRRNAAFSIIEDLLPILDNLYLGVDAAKKAENLSTTVQGFQLVLDQFKAVLINAGVQELNPMGAPFDPNEHECVSIVPSPDVEENKIVSVTRLGYRLNSRLLRPASVVVSSGKANSENGK